MTANTTPGGTDFDTARGAHICIQCYNLLSYTFRGNAYPNTLTVHRELHTRTAYVSVRKLIFFFVSTQQLLRERFELIYTRVASKHTRFDLREIDESTAPAQRARSRMFVLVSRNRVLGGLMCAGARKYAWVERRIRTAPTATAVVSSPYRRTGVRDEEVA